MVHSGGNHPHTKEGEMDDDGRGGSKNRKRPIERGKERERERKREKKRDL